MPPAHLSSSHAHAYAQQQQQQAMYHQQHAQQVPRGVPPPRATRSSSGRPDAPSGNHAPMDQEVIDVLMNLH
jgi:hypothetical protein